MSFFNLTVLVQSHAHASHRWESKQYADERFNERNQAADDGDPTRNRIGHQGRYDGGPKLCDSVDGSMGQRMYRATYDSDEDMFAEI